MINNLKRRMIIINNGLNGFFFLEDGIHFSPKGQWTKRKLLKVLILLFWDIFLVNELMNFFVHCLVWKSVGAQE